jgi:steroid delta-isomerase-like uncharacterized protein
MSATAQACIAAYYDAFNRGDFAGMLSLLAEDIAHDINQGEREIGITAFRHFLERMTRCYREQLSELVIMSSADGTRGAAEYIVEGSYLASDEGLPPAQGQRYRLPGGAFFELRAGKITRVSNYYNLNDWVAQVKA